MATSYPYVSSLGAVVKAIEQFRKAFPPTVTSEVLQKFGIAPGNESYIIALFKFLELIDADGNKIDDNVKFFYSGNDDFQKGLETRVLDTYSALFSERGNDAWTEPKAALTTWFRVTDNSSELVGGRQAGTFLTLAGMAGHGDAPKATSSSAPKSAAKKTPAKKAAKAATADIPSGSQSTPVVTVPTESSVGLTVRIEVNLPAGGTPDVYDSIFASIRKHLIDP